MVLSTPTLQKGAAASWHEKLGALSSRSRTSLHLRHIRGGQSNTPSRIRNPARVYGGRARVDSKFSESEERGLLMSASRKQGGLRYPRSYAPEVPLKDPALPMSIKSGATPWKGPTTPHYIHAKPTPSGLHAEADSEQQFGEVVCVEPTKRHTASVIWLHGLGDTGHTWSAVASWLEMSWCRFIFPTAPSQPVQAQHC